MGAALLRVFRTADPKTFVSSLDTIRIYHQNFLGGEHEVENGEGEFIATLLQTLKERKDAGFPILKIVISFCRNVDQRDIVKLQQLVGTVEYDNHKGRDYFLDFVNLMWCLSSYYHTRRRYPFHG